MKDNALDFIRVSTNPIIFRDMERGETDSIQFVTVNITKKTLVVRFSIPNGSGFRMNSIIDVKIPPGLQEIREISYSCVKDEFEQSDLVISSPMFNEYKVPIMFYPQSPAFDVDNKSFDLGLVNINTTHKCVFTLSNFGTKGGNYSILCTEPHVSIDPSYGYLDSNRKEKITISFKVTSIKRISFAVKIVPKSSFYEGPTISILGEAFEQSIYLVSNNEPISTIVFGRAFFGEKIKRTVTLINKSPIKRSFVVHPSHEPGRKSHNEPAFTAIPSEGELIPNGSTEISFFFQPAYQKLSEDVEVFYSQSTNIEIVKTQNSVPITFEGSAVQMLFKLSCVDFLFGEQQVGSNSYQTLMLSNNSQFHGLNFNLKKVAHFHFRPNHGVIPPNSNVDISVSFDPKSLGDHSTTSVLDLCNGLFQRELHLSGYAIHNGDLRSPRPTRALSTDTIASTLCSEYKTQNTTSRQRDNFIEELALQRSNTLRKGKLKKMAYNEARHMLEKTNGPFSVSDIEELAKKTLENKLLGGEDPIELGLGHCEGMEPPEPPIFSPKSPKISSLIDIQSPRSYKIEKKSKNIRPIKTKPTTPNEIADCSKALTPSQQLLFLLSTENLDFGSISVLSDEKRDLIITNNLSQYAFVTLKLDEKPELSKTPYHSQVIPPNSTSVFEITLSLPLPQRYSATIPYIINGIHEGIITLSAISVPIDVKLSKSSIEFDYRENISHTSMKEYLTLTNNSGSKANVKWIGFTDTFSISPLSGIIQPKSTLSCEVVYKPGIVSHSDALLTLQVEGGPQRLLKCKGIAGEPNISIKGSPVKFDLIPLGIERIIDVTLKNDGIDPGFFIIAPYKYDFISIKPSNGIIKPNESQSLSVIVKCTKPGVFDADIPIEVYGQNPIKLKVIGNAENPQIQLKFSNLDFGKVFIGTSDSRIINIRNVGRISAVVFLDLGYYNQFSLDFNQNLNIESSEKPKNSITIVDSIAGDNRSSFQSLSKIPTLNKASGPVYKINLEEESSISVRLVFKPTIIGDFSFELPFMMIDNTYITSDVQPMVIAESIQAPIVSSISSIDFGVTPLYDPLNPNIRPNIKHLTLMNKTKDPVNFVFECSDNKRFIIEPISGTIEYGFEIPIVIAFRPDSVDPITTTIKLNSVSNNESVLTGCITLSGVGYNRPYKASQECVCLPPVPLNCKVETTIYVINTLYIESNLQIVLPINEKSFPLSISFPDGNRLLHTVSQIPLKISFSSDKPLSFSTLVAIIDDLGDSYSFSVSVSTDNSIFSLYHLFSPLDISLSAGQGKPIMASLPSSFVKNSFIGLFSSYQNQFDKMEKLRSHSVSTENVAFVTNFLNSFASGSRIDRFPYDMIKYEGQKVIEMITYLAGSKKPANMKLNDTSKYSKMKSLINILVSQGAALSMLRPEYLLSKEDYLDFYRKKTIRFLLGIDYYGAPEMSSFNQEYLSRYISTSDFNESVHNILKIYSSLFDSLSVESWLLVVYQIIKIYVYPKIDIERFSTTPGLSDALKYLKESIDEDLFNEINRSQKSLNTSNVFSAQECAILKWCSVYHHVHFKSKGSVISFNSCEDMKSFFALFKSHYLSTVPEINENDKSELSKAVVECFKNLKLGFSPSLDVLSSGNPIVYALLSFSLFQVLPHYIPSSAIEFEAELNKTMSQSVTLTNPSKQELVYNASINGSDNFSLEQNRIVLQPQENTDLIIKYFARSHHSDTATLIIVPVKQIGMNQPVLSSTLVISMKSTILVSNPQKVFNLEGPIYSTTSMKMKIRNEVLRAGLFRINVQFSHIVDDKPCSLRPLNEFVVCHKSSSSSVFNNISKFEQNILQHSPFILSSQEIEFPEQDSDVMLNIEFVPISLGDYRCHLLFHNDSCGEFIYEVNGHSTPPTQIESNTIVKTEANVKVVTKINIDSTNKNLASALAYSMAKTDSLIHPGYISDVKFREMILSNTREIIANMAKSPPITYYTSFSSPFFDSQKDIVVSKGENHALSVSFLPNKPGTFPAKLVLLNDFDVRVFKIVGTAIAQTKTFTIQMETASGKGITQEIPFQNPSEQIWNYKVSLSGDQGFDCIQRFSVKPQSTFNLVLSFKTRMIGSFSTFLSVVNLVKENTVNYQINVDVGEPPAEEKIILSCHAREKTRHTIHLPDFIESGTIQVVSDIPVITFPSSVYLSKGLSSTSFEFEIYALRSGISAGTIKFLDPSTNAFIWYIIEISIEKPVPEQVIDISTPERQPINVTFPVDNPKSKTVTFHVTLSDNDLFGEKTIQVPPMSHVVYSLVVHPLRVFKRTSSVSFFNEDEGEYIYLLNINVIPSEPCILAPLKASIGNYSSTYIQLDNPTNKPASLRVENTISDCFRLNVKPFFQIPAGEKRNIEIKYTPSKVGVVQSGIISFRSREIGDWVYKVTGIGKPPIPVSPMIVESSIGTSTSGSIMFSNPFSFPSTFEAILLPDKDSSFKFLSKKHQYTYNEYGESQQISFAFSAKAAGQFQSSIMVSTVGIEPRISWHYPLIGVAILGTETIIPELKGQVDQVIQKTLELPLIGETEGFSLDNYIVKVELPIGYDWMTRYIDTTALSLRKSLGASIMKISMRFNPRRRVSTVFHLCIENPASQKWRFPVFTKIESGGMLRTMYIESTLNKISMKKVVIPEPITQTTDFHAYFTSGSSVELSLSQSDGIMEQSFADENEISLSIVFHPRTYGKLVKGILIIETEEIEYNFEIIGKMPEYVPPVISKSALINTSMPESARAFNRTHRGKKRNIIRENIQKVKIMKPNSARRQ